MSGESNITGIYGCSCHPFSSWKESDKAHKQRFSEGTRVQHRCTGETGVIYNEADKQGFCTFLVDPGTTPGHQHLAHVAELISIS